MNKDKMLTGHLVWFMLLFYSVSCWPHYRRTKVQDLFQRHVKGHQLSLANGGYVIHKVEDAGMRRFRPENFAETTKGQLLVEGHQRPRFIYVEEQEGQPRQFENEEAERYENAELYEHAPPRNAGQRMNAELYEDTGLYKSPEGYRNAKPNENAEAYKNAVPSENAGMYKNVESSENAGMYRNAESSENAGMYKNAESSENAGMYRNAESSENAGMYKNAESSENAGMYRNAESSENAGMYKNAEPSENAGMYKNAESSENAGMYRNAESSENAEAHENAEPSESSRLYNNAELLLNAQALRKAKQNGNRDGFNSIYGFRKAITPVSAARGMRAKPQVRHVYYIVKGRDVFEDLDPEDSIMREEEDDEDAASEVEGKPIAFRDARKAENEGVVDDYAEVEA